jgi:hypothetical protein
MVAEGGCLTKEAQFRSLNQRLTILDTMIDLVITWTDVSFNLWGDLSCMNE